MNIQKEIDGLKAQIAELEKKQAAQVESTHPAVFVCNDPEKEMWIVGQGIEGEWRTVSEDGSQRNRDHPAFRDEKSAAIMKEWLEVQMLLMAQPGACAAKDAKVALCYSGEHKQINTIYLNINCDLPPTGGHFPIEWFRTGRDAENACDAVGAVRIKKAVEGRMNWGR
jgi:hypothetical protein